MENHTGKMSRNALPKNAELLSQELEASKMIQEQIGKITFAQNFETAVKDMMATLGPYMKAERMYIFEDKENLPPNIYAWCADGNPVGEELLHKLTRDELRRLTDILAEKKYVYIPNVEEIKESRPDIYHLFVQQGIHSTVEVPVLLDDRLVGFLGVDNAPSEIIGLIVNSLYTLSIFLSSVMQVRKERAKIIEQNRELELEKRRYRDALSNRCEFCFSFDVTEGFLHEEFITSHGINLVKLLGLSLPVSFDEMNEKYISRYELKLLSSDMETNFTCQGLLSKYEKGITSVESEYYSSVSDIYVRVLSLLSKDEATGHIHAVVIATDTSKARKKEAKELNRLIETKEKLTSSNQEISLQLETVLNGIDGGFKIIREDRDFSYVYVSEGLAAIQGYTVEEFMKVTHGSSLENCYISDREQVSRSLEKQNKADDNYWVKYRVKHKNGSLKWIVDSGRRVEDADGNVSYYGLFQDVTEMEERNIALQNANDMQSQIMSAISCGVFAYTLPERNLIAINEVAKKIMECETENNFVQEFEDFYVNRVVPRDFEMIHKLRFCLKKPGDQMDYIFRAKKKDGGLAVIQCSTKMLSFVEGKQYILSSMLDITEERNLQNLLATERRQYRNVLLSGAELSFAMDLTKGYVKDNVHTKDGEVSLQDLGINGTITYNDMVARWIELKKVKPLSENAQDVVHREVLLENYAKGISRIEKEYYSSEYDRYYDILVLLSEIEENGHVYAIFIAYDTTEKKKEEQEQAGQMIEARRNLSAANEELHRTIQSEKEKIAVISAMSNIYYSSYMIDLSEKSIIRISGSGAIGRYFKGKGDAADVFSQWIKEVLDENFREKMTIFTNLCTLPERMKDTQIISCDCISKEAGWIQVSFIVVDRDGEGLFRKVLLVAQHIDAAKQKELAAQEALKVACDAANKANEAKSSFLASMSHDIRTPMNAIIGMTAIAGTHLDDRERVSDCLSKITVSSKHLLGLINEVLDMSKIESGKLDLIDEEFSLPELIDNLLAMVEPQIKARRHELSVSIRGMEHEKVIGDSQRIQQCFMNLMGNAIKYTPEGGKISLNVSEKPVNKKKVGCYEFIFEDNGIGMEKDFIQYLFDPFARAVDSRVSKVQGAGLGMAITHNIVQMMNGNIQVESELNKGTKITVTIVLKLQDEESAFSQGEFVDLPVLVTDDDVLACESACEILEELGMKGEWVLSGKEAVELAEKRHESGDDFFAVIIDWKMPEMDGIETTKEMRRRIGEDVPIVIISAYDWSDIEQEARAAGANAFISKPLFKSRVVRLFNELIGNNTEEEESDSLGKIIKEDFSGRRALLVEDNELNAEIAGEILGMTGMSVDYARDGKEALDIMAAVSKGYYDIVFMDIQMPVMNGYDTTRAIRSLPGDYTRSVPIIAMTANAFTDDIQAAKRAGMNQHVAKPIDFHKLMGVLHKWLD